MAGPLQGAGADQLHALSIHPRGVGHQLPSAYVDPARRRFGSHIADCLSAGHDLVAFDYRSPGQPAVVRVDQERNCRITVLAPNFETFVAGLAHAAEIAQMPRFGPRYSQLPRFDPLRTAP
ncbi:hypothetical protein ACIBVK_16565 [Micromonospora echinofusca]|uniref:hypothetical protein n=1 Tax=Micromonospora echinofusca TaxID=47858 RepID=UPI0037BDC61C